MDDTPHRSSLPTTPPQFASRAHLKALRQRVSDGGYGGFNESERWYYHAYDYAWRRMFLGQRNDQSPTDPDGTWLDIGLVEKASPVCRQLAGPDKKYPSQETVREDFERLAIREWTEGELALKLRETEDICRERGYPLGEPDSRERISAWAMVARDAIKQAAAKWGKVFSDP
jgi:hypothetical protein